MVNGAINLPIYPSSSPALCGSTPEEGIWTADKCDSGAFSYGYNLFGDTGLTYAPGQKTFNFTVILPSFSPDIVVDEITYIEVDCVARQGLISATWDGVSIGGGTLAVFNPGSGLDVSTTTLPYYLADAAAHSILGVRFPVPIGPLTLPGTSHALVVTAERIVSEQYATHLPGQYVPSDSSLSVQGILAYTWHFRRPGKNQFHLG
jgi:hypothetical protein